MARITEKIQTPKKDVRESTCIHCGHLIGERVAVRIESSLADGGEWEYAHSKCASGRMNVLREQEQEAEANKAQAEKEEREARWAANTERRGDLPRFADLYREADDGDLDEEKNLRRTMYQMLDSRKAWETARENFAAELAKNPAHAMTWADNVVSKAAAQEINADLKHAFNRGLSADEILNVFQDRLLREAGDPGRSTSDMSNLVQRNKIATLSSVVACLTGKYASW
jgi:hypothetical protein